MKMYGVIENPDYGQYLTIIAANSKKKALELAKKKSCGATDVSITQLKNCDYKGTKEHVIIWGGSME